MAQAGSQFSISGKVIVITGGEGVIGSSLAEIFAGEGARIVLLGINDKKGTEISESINSSGGSSIFIHVDVLVKASLEKAAEKVIETFGRVDVLINAAGGNKAGATIAPNQSIFDLDIEDFRSVSELNLDGTVLSSIVFGRMIAESGKGVIINFSSMAASRPLTRVVGYSASKAAVDNFTKWMAVEMADKYGDGVRVNAVAPGFLVTEQNRDLLLKSDGSLTDRGEDIIRQTPFKRFGKPEEIAGTVMWLCSDASSFVTGAIIPIDGGFSAFSI